VRGSSNRAALRAARRATHWPDADPQRPPAQRRDPDGGVLRSSSGGRRAVGWKDERASNTSRAPSLEAAKRPPLSAEKSTCAPGLVRTQCSCRACGDAGEKIRTAPDAKPAATRPELASG
jgi:hypothetical protein